MPHPLVEQLRFARSEFRRGLVGVTDEEARRRFLPINSISWNIGHLAWQEQRYWLLYPQGIMLLPEEREKASFDAGRSGAQANVVVFTDDGFILNPVSRLWLKMIALFSYLQ